jgi:hypothetical protein
MSIKANIIIHAIKKVIGYCFCGSIHRVIIGKLGKR